MMCYRFDLLANGGASLTLSFERAPFLTQYRTVWVPWNVFYVMDTLVMKKVSRATAVSLDICLPSRVDGLMSGRQEQQCCMCHLLHNYGILKLSTLIFLLLCTD